MNDYIRGILIGTTATLVVLAAALSILFAIQQPLPPTPVAVEIVDDGFPPDHVVCPGYLVLLRNRADIRQPVDIDILLSVMDKEEKFNIPGRQTLLPTRPHPRAGVIPQLIPWTVPPLDPGEYIFVVSIDSHESNYGPIYQQIPFRVREDCI